jgi:hypothetical protein
MPLLKTLVRGLSRAPGYTLMRGAARFALVRSTVASLRTAVHAGRLSRFLRECDQRMQASVFHVTDREAFVATLRADGVALGLRLPPTLVQEIETFAREAPCHADREETQGFSLSDHAQAQDRLRKPILVAQYFNAAQGCAAIGRLVRDPLLLWVAGRFLGSMPTLVGVNLWWTFPVDASQEDRDRHAHMFHRDVDDFRFFKFFFYISDVEPGDGGHVCVLGSHRRPPARTWFDRWMLRRYGDAEVEATYPAAAIREITGPAGTGFAENTLCLHKGRTPTHQPRLLLQLQFALFDYGVQHDERAPAVLQLLAGPTSPAP